MFPFFHIPLQFFKNVFLIGWFRRIWLYQTIEPMQKLRYFIVYEHSMKKHLSQFLKTPLGLAETGHRSQGLNCHFTKKCVLMCNIQNFADTLKLKIHALSHCEIHVDHWSGLTRYETLVSWAVLTSFRNGFKMLTFLLFDWAKQVLECWMESGRIYIINPLFGLQGSWVISHMNKVKCVFIIYIPR